MHRPAAALFRSRRWSRTWSWPRSRHAVAAGTGHKDGSAAMQFTLHQDFEIVPTRAALRPPRLVLAGWVIGALIPLSAKAA